MSIYNNIFSQEDIDYINILPEVIDAKNKITSNNTTHTFFISLTDSIRTSLSTLGLDLTNITQIPMRWIVGDTAEHIDHGKSQFNNTYLVFINNSPGTFVLTNTTYPIVENTAFVFNEGIVHKTQDTQGLRLLLGPMNEFAEPVGGSIPCFVGNTRVLTNNGYKQINQLNKNDLIITSDNKTQSIILYTTKVYCATTEDAPYIIEPHAFGENKPVAPVYLSPEHKIYLGNNIWTTSAVESKTNPLVKQYGIGEEIIYYHIECANYFTDNLVTEDLIVESFGTHKSTGTTDAVWYKTENGYSRKNN